MIEIFLLAGAIILVGFFGSIFFEKTKIPDALLLLLLGLVLGPLTGSVNAAQFVSWAPFIGALALIVVLLGGGFKLNLVEVVTRLPEAGLFSVCAMIMGALAGAAVLHYAFAWPLMHALFAGVIFSGYSSNIILPIISKLSASNSAKTLVSLESVINDVLCIVFALVILGVAADPNAVSLSSAAKDLASAFTTAIVVGSLFGVFWVRVLQWFRGKSLGYIVTLAVVFIMYSFNEAIGGSGAISVLVFGLVLGNGDRLAEAFKWKGDYSLGSSITEMQAEVSFFVNTFFFVYLGILFDFKAFNLSTILVVAALLVALYAGRAVAVTALARINRAYERDKGFLLWLAPRGLAAAVLAFLPAGLGINIPSIVDAAFLVILFTNLIAGIALFSLERQRPALLPRAAQAQKAEKKQPRIVQ